MTVPPSKELPLTRYTVLDLTLARAGPTAVRLLSDWGANVIRIDQPAAKNRSITGDRRDSDEQNLHRNKRSLCLDLKTDAGLQVLQRLIARSDVVVENFRAGVKRRLGLAYEDLRRVNPRIILASISGFGQDGPYSERPGVDQVVQGMSGLMSITGEPGRGPMRTGIAISDTAAGMVLGQGILLALLHRELTGEGQWVHTSLLESMMNNLDFQAARYTVNHVVPQQAGNSHPTLTPMNVYRSCDGLVNITASNESLWAGFCNALDTGALNDRQEYRTAQSRTAHKERLDADVNAVTERFSTAELIERLNGAGVPCGPINNISQAFDDPQVRHLRMTRRVRHAALGDIDLLRSPINLSLFAQPDHFERPAPDAGEHSSEVLRELGYGDDAIDALRAQGAVH